MRPSRREVAMVAMVAVVMSAVLASFGQPLWCACGRAVPWSFEVWSSHNSQHVLDPYALSHVLHGVVLFPVLALLLRGERARWRLPVAALLEAAWEVFENTPMVIERYRANTASLDYAGDSVANSLADLAACLVGFVATASMPWWGGVGLFVALEAISVWWIRDSLLLNVLMLTYPIDAVREWQTPPAVIESHSPPEPGAAPTPPPGR